MENAPTDKISMRYSAATVHIYSFKQQESALLLLTLLGTHAQRLRKVTVVVLSYHASCQIPPSIIR